MGSHAFSCICAVLIQRSRLRRIQLAKKQRDRERKNPEPNARRNLANVRVKQKSQVHIQGLTSRYANEDTLPAMKGYDQFGQYGRILKLFLAKRTVVPDNIPSHGSNQPVHVYINYSSAREASACIAAVDGTSSPDGSRLRAGWGTTKYCQAYLRGQRCTNENCMMAHEAGEEIDPVNGAPGGVTREELSTIKHALKEQETKEFQSRSGPPLPSSAAWGNKPSQQPTPIGPSHPLRSTIGQRSAKTTAHSLPTRPSVATNENIPSGPAAGPTRGRQTQSQRARGKQPEAPVAEASSSLDEPSHDIDEPEPSTPLEEEPTPRAPQTSMPPGLYPLPSSSAITASPIEANYEYEDNPLESFGSGSFTFSFAMDIGNSPKMDSTLTDQHLGIGSDLSNHNNPAIESMTSMSSPHLRSDLSLFPHDELNGGENGRGYKGAFDPFAETPDEIAKDDKARPKSSRFDFARKGLFGSSESLAGMASPVDLAGMNLPPRTGSSNGLPPLMSNHRSVSPSSYFDSRTSSQANSPKRGPVALSPPPGLKPNHSALASPALWSASSSSAGPSHTFSPPLPGGFDSEQFFRSNQFSASALPLTSAATQPLPPVLPHLNTSVPPGFSSASHALPLRSALVTSAYPLPPLQRNFGKEESFGQGQEGFQYRSGSAGPL